ncbi:uncharacterized protein LOC135702848 [Ochlerotatus camptorhynchus]|uniref:uncharacterized protein LOC135702848 n=1 Tax=Ochlerotatus camptorhynchus TaxID=644619 RepID=UPI0031E4099B
MENYRATFLLDLGTLMRSETLDPTPTLREVKDAIQQLKNNKAAGKDGIAAKLIKMGPENSATCLHRIIVRIWETEQLPVEWKEGAAYESIDRTELWKIMDENGIPWKLIRLIKATMDGVQNCVRVSGELSSSFESRRGL